MARPFQFYLQPLLFFLLIFSFILTTSQIFGEKQRVRVSGEIEYFPYSFINENGEADGFDVEIARAVAEIVNIEMDLVLNPWTEVMRLLNNGETDVVIDIYYSESRDELMDFTIPYNFIYYNLFVPEKSNIKEFRDIEGHKIIVPEGYLIYEHLMESGADIDLITVKSNKEALTLLSNGKYDAAVMERMQGFFQLKALGIRNVTLLETGFLPQKACFAVTTGNTALLNKLNEGFNLIKQNGTYAVIYNKWFGIIEKKSFFQKYRTYFILFFIAALLILSTMLLWNRSLNRRVKSKTKSLNDEIIQRKLAEQHLEKSLQEKEIMLAEIHHRVKNNLQIMISLMELQKECDIDKLSEHFIRSTQSRINTMALIHEHLYSTQNFSEINISAYIDDLTAYLISVYQIPGTHIKIKLDIPDFHINYEKTISIGLIISEILTNSIKHAFRNSENGIIYLSAKNEGKYFSLKLSDNGPGFSAEKQQARSLGLILIDILTMQLNAILEKTGEKCTSYTLKIPVKGLTDKVPFPD